MSIITVALMKVWTMVGNNPASANGRAGVFDPCARFESAHAAVERRDTCARRNVLETEVWSTHPTEGERGFFAAAPAVRVCLHARAIPTHRGTSGE
eukprot:4821-Eustigmatos_ZCMA.PRE.1